MLAKQRLRIVIPGGTGQLGTMLAQHFHRQGHVVSSVTRFPKPHEWESVHWDAEHMSDWAATLNGADAVINLAGRSLLCRHTEANRRLILDTRVRTTRLVGQAIAQCAEPPRVWLNASTIGVYGDSEDEADESNERTHDGTMNWRFPVELAKAWEGAVDTAITPKTRKVTMRLSNVMSLDKGRAFDNWLRLVRMGWGGEVGDGEQYVSWIHDFDFVRAVEFLIDQHDLSGPINLAAPGPVKNHEFMCNLRRAWCTSYFGLPVPKWLVSVVALCINREPQLVLSSSRVIPRRLLDAGFSFHFPQWRGACSNLVARWRIANCD